MENKIERRLEKIDPARPLLDETARRDFFEAVRRLGYGASEFTVVAGTKTVITLNNRTRTRQDVTVARARAHVQLVYEGGHGFNWVADAILDVENGTFGLPLASSHSEMA